MQDLFSHDENMQRKWKRGRGRSEIVYISLYKLIIKIKYIQKFVYYSSNYF